MSDLRVTNLKGRTAGSAPTLPDGVVITGVATATSFSGNLTGTATGLSGNPIISVSGVNNSGVSTLLI
jgi:predicted TIM-barrel enzyme